MNKLIKNKDKFFLYIFFTVIISLSSLFDLLYAMDKPSLISRFRHKREHSNFYPKLRGEIWYGNASWYGPKFQGKKTSNGEKFNKNKLTAAHQTLPFNTQVLVTNLQNNKSVVVRINDRGPFKSGRIIDLSEEAAEKIDSRKQGTTYVKLQVLTPIVENQEIKDLKDET